MARQGKGIYLMNAPARLDNRPALTTTDQLAKDFAHVIAEIAAIEEKAAEAPPVLEDDDDLDLLRKIVGDARAARKRAAEDLHDETKAPYLAAGRVVDGFFFGLRDRMAAVEAKLAGIAKPYLDKKAELERKAREEAERKAAEEARRCEQEAIKAAQANKSAEETRAAMTAAAQAQERAKQTAIAAQAEPPDLAKTKTASGTSNLEEIHTFRILDWNAIELEKLRPFLKRTEVEGAIDAVIRNKREEIKTGKFKLAGVEIGWTTRAKFK
jgi:hypothetical protein